MSDLLAPEPGRAPPPPTSDADLLRLDPLTPVAQERCELAPAYIAAVERDDGRCFDWCCRSH
jgi:hypothetical protein